MQAQTRFYDLYEGGLRPNRCFLFVAREKVIARDHEKIANTSCGKLTK